MTNPPAADTSLIEVAPNNSNGGQAWTLSGRTQNGPHVRALYRFDLSVLPTNALVLSGAFQVDCTGKSGEPMCVTGSTYGLHRMFRSWGEGTNAALLLPGQGLPANPGDATWTYAHYPTNAWSTPGGQAGADFSALESAFQDIPSDGATYRFESTPELVDDLQGWVQSPSANFGWIMISGSEDIICTAKRFSSREDPNVQPQLEVEFRVPPRFDSAQRVGNQFLMRFTPWPGQGYSVEYRTNLTTAFWQSLTNLGFATNAAQLLVTDSVNAARRFYRLSAY
jgi:hypothetical protein